jgi:flavin-dependent dehydrogenase
MYDAIVIGARAAGAPTAMLLARLGWKVLLADRARFPSDIPHGHFIHRYGPGLLQQWGLLDQVVASGCPPVTAMTSDFGDFPLTGRDLVVGGVALGYAPRRLVLDQLLVEAARAAGADVREGFAVTDFLTDGNRLAGIRGRDTRTGAAASETARIVIGADGRNSRLAQAVQAPTYNTAPALTFWYWSYWSGLPDRGLELYVRSRRAIFTFATHGGLQGIFVGWPAAELDSVRGDVERQFLAVLALVPDLAERVSAGRREERFAGATNLPNFYRKPYGPGWALVGDAGFHKDPFLALGICDAFRDAQALVTALDHGLAGRQPLEAALADYEQRRNTESARDYQLGLAVAQLLPPPPETLALRAALRGNQPATNHFFLASQGMVPRETFFNSANLAQLLPSRQPIDPPRPTVIPSP